MTAPGSTPPVVGLPGGAGSSWVLPLASVVQFVLALDVAIINVALSTVQHELDLAPAQLPWVLTAYALTFGAFLMTGGRLGDRFGLRRVLLVGMALFALASVSGGLAPDGSQLIASRLIQGVGAALMAPTAFALLTAAYPDPRRRATAVSPFQGANAAGGLAGVLLGGLITASIGWRWVLLTHPPVIAVTAALIVARVSSPVSRSRTRVDAAGAAALSLGVAGLIVGVSELQRGEVASPACWVPLAVAVAATAALVAVERGSADPMLPVALLRDGRWNALVATCLLGATMGGYAYYLALYLQRVLGFSAAATGFAFLPATITGLVAATQLAPRLLPRIGARRGLLLALTVLCSGQLWLSRLPSDGSWAADVVPGALLTAVGLGLAFPAAALLLSDHVPVEHLGVAGALFPTGQQIDSAIGLAGLAAVASLPAATRAASYDRAFLAAAACAAAAGVLTACGHPSWDSAGPRRRSS